MRLLRVLSNARMSTSHLTPLIPSPINPKRAASAKKKRRSAVVNARAKEKQKDQSQRYPLILPQEVRCAAKSPHLPWVRPVQLSPCENRVVKKNGPRHRVEKKGFKRRQLVPSRSAYSRGPSSTTDGWTTRGVCSSSARFAANAKRNAQICFSPAHVHASQQRRAAALSSRSTSSLVFNFSPTNTGIP